MSANTLIISNNTDNSHHKLEQLIEHVHKNNPVAVLIQDPPQKNPATIIAGLCSKGMDFSAIGSNTQVDSFNSKNFTLTLINNELATIVHNLIQYEETLNIAITGIMIRLKEMKDKRINLYNIYIRPNASAQSIKKLFQTIKATANTGMGLSRTIVAGDVNAPITSNDIINHQNIFNTSYNSNSQLHYSQIKLNRSRLLAREARKLRLTIINDQNEGPTFTLKEKRTSIDVAMVGNKAIRQWTNFKLHNYGDGTEGHQIIHVSTKKKTKQTKTRIQHIMKTELIKQHHFLAFQIRNKYHEEKWILRPRNEIIKLMNKIANDLYSTIIDIQKLVTTTRITKVNRSRTDNVQHTCTGKIKRAQNKIDKLKEQKKKIIGTQLNKTWRMKLIGIQQIRKIDTKINWINEKIINIMIRDENVRNQETNETVWEKSKRAKHTNLQLDNTQQDTITEDELESIAEQKFPRIYRISENTLETELTNGINYQMRISNREIDNAIHELRNKRYTGIEGVKFSAFNKITQFANEEIRTICKMSFWTAATPGCCQTNIGKLIPKKNPGQFRIVHIGTPLSCLLEQIALHRLEYALEEKKLYNHQQYGFMPKRDRHDLITRLILFTKRKYMYEQDLQRKTRTTLFSLDIEGAFDNVNQDVIIDKLITELEPNPIRVWLSKFVLNRNIVITTHGKYAGKRLVCKGVPQGSSLGPILWNFTINQIDKNARRKGITEILTYADDIILAINGNDKEYAQKQLEQLIDRIKLMKLSVNPGKSNTMVIHRDRRDYSQHEYKINGQIIKTVKTLTILGIQVNDRLKLDTRSEKLRTQINNQTIKLMQLNKTGLFKQYKDWRILIDSYLTSTTVMNNLPILAIDPKGRKWTDNVQNKCMKAIFNWPNNISEKLIRLTTGTLKTETIIKHALRRKTDPETRDMYNNLLGLMQGAESQETEFNTEIIHRRITNPELTLERREEFNIENCQQPAWFITETNTGSYMIEWYMGTALQMKAAKHTTYSISYFNTLTLLWHNAENQSITNRNLILAETNSLYQALRNNQNHDWRVITLRERMMKAKWEIRTITHEQNTAITDEIQSSIIIINRDQSNNHNDTHQSNTIYWKNANNSTETSQTSNTKIEQYNQPEISDYRIRNNRRRTDYMEKKTEFENCHTFISRTLNKDIQYWQQKTSPNLLSSATMIMLTGLYNNEITQRLEQGNLTREETPAGCTDTNCKGPIRYGNTSAIIIEAMASSITRDDSHFWGFNVHHVTLHRALECPRYDDRREEIDNMIFQTARTITTNESNRTNTRTTRRNNLAKKTYLAIWNDQIKRSNFLRFITSCSQ